MNRFHIDFLIAMGLVGLATSALAQVSISQAGQPQITVPLAVPPGMATLTPRLALRFTGDQAPGPLGPGWKLDGLSVVTRCSPIKAIDAKSAGISYTSSDKVCLDGQRLIQTDYKGNPLPVANQISDAAGTGTATREYRTQLDSFSRVVAAGDENGNSSYGPHQFVVKTKDGRVMTYTAIDAQNSKAAAVWPVTNITDNSFFGDFIKFTYSTRSVSWGSGTASGGTVTPNAGQEWNLSEIDYAGSSLDATSNKVLFDYEDRPDNPGGAQDRSEAYNQGSKNVGIQRLIAIRTYVNASGTPVAAKSYRFGYDTSPTTGRSRLTRITECAGDTTASCQPPTILAYASGGDETYVASTGFAQSGLATTTLTSTNKSYGVLLGDFNGDGKTDIIRWSSSSPASNQLWISQGGQFTPASNTGLTGDLLFSSDGCYSSIVTDINGDGLPDIFRYSGPVAPSGASCSSYGQPLVFINNGNNTFTRQVVSSPTLTLASGSAWKNFLVFDADGDGRADIVTAVPPQTGALTPPCPDGYPCASLYLGSGSGTFSPAASSNMAKTALTIPPIAGMPAGSGYVADLDGDGQLDIVSGTSFNNSFFAYTSQANGYFTATSTPACPLALDVNGDGRADCLDPTAGTLQIGDGRTAFQTGTYNIPASTTSGTTQGVLVLDANHDGRYDLLRWTNGVTSTNPNVLYLSNGDGSFRKSSSFANTLGTVQLKSSDGSHDVLVGDFTGNGATELLAMNANGSNTLYVKADSSPPDVLTSVTSPLGLKTMFSYEPLSNSTHYTTGRIGNGSVILPKEDITPPLYVVVSAQSDTGIGAGTLTRTYAYKGLRGSMDGHGLLGFQEFSEQGKAPDGSDATKVTDFFQDAPYIGLPSTTQTYVGTLSQLGQRLARTTYSYCDATSPAAPTAINTSNPAAPTPCTVSALVNQPYAYQSFAETWDPQGNSLSTVLTTRSVDAFGDETSKTVTVTGSAVAGGSEAFTETTTSEYCAPLTNDTSPTCPSGAPNPNNIQSPSNTTGGYWYIGHPTQVVVTRTVPDTLPATAAGSSPTASAVAGTGAAPAPSAAVLNVILSLLLDD